MNDNKNQIKRCRFKVMTDNNFHRRCKATKTYQYGVPLKELHLCPAVAPWDETPKSAVK